MLAQYIWTHRACLIPRLRGGYRQQSVTGVGETTQTTEYWYSMCGTLLTAIHNVPNKTTAVPHAIAGCYEHLQLRANEPYTTPALRVLMIRRFVNWLLLSKERRALQAGQLLELRSLVLGSLVPGLGCVRGLVRLVLGVTQPAAVVAQEVAADVGGLLRSARTL